MLLRLENVGKVFGAQCVLQDVSLEIGFGEVCALIGPSGSGKSTLLNLIGLLDRPSSGRLVIDGWDATAASAEAAAGRRNALIGFVFQSFHLLPRLTAWQNVALPLVYRGLPTEQRRARALEALSRVGAAALAERAPNTLSGGQQQRVAIARALAGEPKLLLADEPTGSLDSRTAGEVMDLFLDLNRARGASVVLVTHDPEIAQRCARQVRIKDGRIVADSRRTTP